MKHSKPPIWWGDGLAIEGFDPENQRVIPVQLTHIEHHICPNPAHAVHVTLYWGDGTMAMLTMNEEGEFTAHPEDTEIAWEESVQRRALIQHQVERILTNQLNGGLT